MKKFFLFLLAGVLWMPVFAEGYQVNVLSARQTGMGHVGTGMKLGAESIHFNPAGLVFMRNYVDLSAGVSAISAKAEYRHEGYSAATDNPLSSPIYAYAAYKIYDNLAAGISLNTPYGNSLKWPKYWAGCQLIQEIALKSFVLQPTVSYKITDKLSVGAGLMLAIGNVRLSRAVMSAQDFQGVGMLLNELLPAAYPGKEQMIGTIRDNYYPPATATLNGKAHLRAGVNVGVLYDFSEKVSVGVSYRSKVKMRVKEGEAELEYVNRTVEELMAVLGKVEVNGARPLAIPKYDQGTFRAELPLPSNTTLGISYRPTDRWELAFDLQYVGWNAYDSLNVYFNQAELGIAPIRAKKDYKNTVAVRVGAQYKTTERLLLRTGLY
ncbi:MAG: outer membrane protein transport protein, partial [Odoribacter sp.]|nr:outer membrane protein transport protein [Odoribacter sp.]